MHVPGRNGLNIIPILFLPKYPLIVYYLNLLSCLSYISDPYGNLVTIQTTVELSDTKVVVGWTLTGREYVKNLTIQISLVEIRGPDNVVFHDVYKFNVTLLTSSEQCFSDLNASDTYQFCVIALLNSGSSKSDCQLGTTTSTDSGVGDRSSCQSVVGAVINKKGETLDCFCW